MKAHTRTVNGKKLVWVPGGIETRMGGKWMEEGEAAQMGFFNKFSRDRESLRGMQEGRGSPVDPSAGGGNLEVIDHVGSLHPTPLWAVGSAAGHGR